jgi:hypothetical protein
VTAAEGALLDLLVERLGGKEHMLDLLAERLAEREASAKGSASGGWIRGAAAAAAYLGCPRSRVYDLVARDEVLYRKDGSRLMFRPEWLDEVGS